eukprot:gene3905-5837_t
MPCGRCAVRRAPYAVLLYGCMPYCRAGGVPCAVLPYGDLVVYYGTCTRVRRT